jgi:hypothetical protein
MFAWIMVGEASRKVLSEKTKPIAARFEEFSVCE